MRKVLWIILVLFGLITFFNSAYTVTEVNQVVVTQFGKPVRTVQKTGLHFKIPFIQELKYFEKRIMGWDGERTQIPTEDKKFIWVDTWARWKIADPLKFFTAVRTESGGQGVLDDQIESAVRDVISSYPLIEAVRNSNREMVYAAEELREARKIPQIELGRLKMLEQIKERGSKEMLENYGMELVDVQIKHINYIDKVREAVYDRMRAERKRIAVRYLSEAKGEENKILGRMQWELDKIKSEGYREAKKIRGKGDAEATKIYARAYKQNPSFYSFLKTLQTYRETFDKDTHLILTTDSDYFELLKELPK